MNESRIKTEIIQSLLFKYIKLLSTEYKDYFKVVDSNMLNDDEMYIFLDKIYQWSDFNNRDMYLLYLDDFEWKCKEFILKLDELLPLEHLIFTEYFHNCFNENNKEYFESCELHFRVKKGDDV